MGFRPFSRKIFVTRSMLYKKPRGKQRVTTISKGIWGLISCLIFVTRNLYICRPSFMANKSNIKQQGILPFCSVTCPYFTLFGLLERRTCIENDGRSMRKVFDPVKQADRPRISIYTVGPHAHTHTHTHTSSSKRSAENFSSSPPRHSVPTYTQYRLSIPRDPISTLSITRVNKMLWLLRHAQETTPTG